MGSRYEKEESRKKILSACVRLFWVQGFRKTPPKQILQEAGVSAGTFYNLYKSKAGVLMELTDFMISQQFGTPGNSPPAVRARRWYTRWKPPSSSR